MRWWLKLLLAVVGLTIVLVAGGYYYLFHMHGLESIASTQINSALRQTMPLKVSIGRIHGSLVDEIILEDVAIRYDDSLGGADLVTIGKLTASYKLSNLLHRSYLFQYVWLDSARVNLSRDSTGKVMLPVRQRQTTGGSGTPPDIIIDDLILNQCAVTIAGPSDTLRFSDLLFNGAIKFEDGTVAASIRQASINSNKEMFHIPGLSGKLTYASGVIATQDLTISQFDGRLKVSGTADLGARSAHFAFNADDADLARISALFGAKLSGVVDAYGNVELADGEVKGNVALGGRFLMADLGNLSVDFRFKDKQLYLDTLYGIALENCALAGNARFNLGVSPEQYSANLSITNFDLKKLVPSSFVSNLNGHLTLQGESFKNTTLVLRIATELYESTFDDYPLQRASGRMVITTDSITFPDTFRVSYFENQFAVVGKVEYSRNIALDVQARLDNLDRYRGKLFLDQPGGRGYAEAMISGRTKDPDLDGYFVSDSVWLYGLYADSCDVSYHVQRFLTGQRGPVVARFRDGSLWGTPYDTAYAILSLDSDVVHVDTAYAHNKYASMAARAEVRHQIYPKEVTVDTLTLHVLNQTLHNRGGMLIAVDSAGFDFRKAAVSSGVTMLMALGRIDYDESMRLALSVNNVPVNNWMRLVREDFPSDGWASFQADLTGTFRNPVFSLRGSVDSLTYDSLVLGDLSLAGKYGQQVFTLDSLLLTSHAGRYTAKGMINVDVDFTSDSLVKPLDQPFDVSITAKDTIFNLVTLVLPNVEDMQGKFKADVRLFGTPNSPHLEGQASLMNGRLKYIDLVDTLRTDSAMVTMKDNQIVIDHIEAYVMTARKGKSIALLDGVITVKSLSMLNYDVNIDIPKEFPARYELDDIQADVEGSLQVEGDTPPTVTGDLTVTSARYRVNFAEPDEGSPLMELMSGDQTWDLNINVDVLSNYWIKNEDIDAEFAGTLNIIREKGNYRFIGQMEVLRGKGFLFDKTFQIDAGSTVSYNNIDTLNPTLNITGSTRITVAGQSADQSRETIDLALQITGTLNNPEIEVTSPGYSREDILPLLVANTTVNDTAQARTMTRIEQRVTDVLSSQLSTQVSQLGTRQLSRLGVETFEIDPTYQGKIDPLRSTVTLGFYTPLVRTYVYSRSALQGRFGQEVGFEYRLNKSFMLEGRKDEDQLYHLNVKLKWEFE